MCLIFCKVQNCGKAYRTVNGLRKHYNTHDDVQPSECPVCEEFFLSESLLNEHIPKHKLPEPKPAATGDILVGASSTKSPGTTGKGSKKASGTSPKTVQCMYCLFTYNRSWDMPRHYAKCKKNPDRVIVCKICRSEIQGRGPYLDHLGSAHKIKTRNKHMCDYCLSLFASVRLLEQHKCPTPPRKRN